MHKATLAVKVATLSALLVSPTISANNVTIYGLGHVSADSVGDGQNSSFYVASNSSRLGLNGSYNISKDVDVIFQYETGVDLTAQGGNDGNGGAESSGQIFTKGRPSYVGLKGSYGTILVGHQNGLDQWANDYNLFADQVGDLGNLWEGSGVPGRLDNVIYYESPKIGNGTIAVTYTPEEGQEDTAKLIVKGNYQYSKLKVGAAYANIGQGELGADDHKAIALTVGYYDDNFSLGGGLQLESDIAGNSGQDRDSYSFGGSLNVGEKGKIKAQFAVSSGDGENYDASQFAVGYDYSLNNKVNLYVAYAKTDNDENVNFSVNGKGHGDKVVPLIGNDPSAFSLGIVAKFDLSFDL